MKKVIIFYVITFCISLGLSLEEHRIDRMFSLFNVVKFKNSGCQATSSAQLQGTCYTETECKTKGGSKDGNCAAGFGVCCVFKVNKCPLSTVTQNCTFIENPGFPTAHTGTGACVFDVTRMQSDICQIRLDFTQTLLAAPVSTTGVCTDDTLVFTPGATKLVTGVSQPANLCGKLTGQHLYMDAGTANTAAKLTFNIKTASTQNWRIKVSQIECSSRNKAPNGCLQYFTGTRNTVTSFNYDGLSTCKPTCNLKGQDYSVCFRKEKGMCGIQFAQTTVTSGKAFQLNSNSATTAVVTAAICTAGYVQITGVSAAEYALSKGAFCGAIFGSIATSTLTNLVHSTDFKLRHVASGSQATLAGFSLDASQTPC
jgi:hypothetical protein